MLVRFTSYLRAHVRRFHPVAPRLTVGWATAGAFASVPKEMGAATFAKPAARSGRPFLAGSHGTRRGRPAGRALRALRGRDRAALDELYDTYAGTVFGYLVSVLRDRGTAEDIHQQVFLEVWQRAPSYDPERASVLTWILTIARSRALDELRRRVPEPRDPSTLTVAPDDDPEHSPETFVERWRVAHLLSLLSAEESELLRMRFYEDLPQTEIAARTGIALGTVKMRMAAALATLRELLDEEGV